MSRRGKVVRRFGDRANERPAGRSTVQKWFSNGRLERRHPGPMTSLGPKDFTRTHADSRCVRLAPLSHPRRAAGAHTLIADAVCRQPRSKATVIERLRLLFRRVIYALRGGFLVRPLLISVVLGLAGMMLSSLEESHPTLSAWVPEALFPSRSDPQVVQIMLATTAGSVMTVVSIVFAILLMTLTLASMQFSPRILVSFVQGPSNPMDARALPGHIPVLPVGAAGRALVAPPIFTGGDRYGRNDARGCFSHRIDLLHQSYFALD